MYAAWSILYQLAHAILHAQYDGQRLESVPGLDTLKRPKATGVLSKITAHAAGVADAARRRRHDTARLTRPIRTALS
ncbi:uncharacterized protein TrAtP1_001179 [Trichoderma atroviride]|uniref:Uncharacterized protein n=1 Tax=Hypocrea atroviridis (strain ATCC 20476 / IMI 206040) TaxID=452589 RepID=G9P2T9_HYPAI|nr:uncharacterized protein TRIATDRAFT_311083 [Trichoderma atroviride IMI 206040]EHK43553.1 hypothetical protein TRIATDRAFT_311083 [Trichoderma atroviride IMI 206040]UKZ59889.1 hypothetical protein TrAtP1_001179 [Trichoderma atroviride]